MFAFAPYRYGAADHVLTVPFLKQWIDPSLYPTDYVVQEKAHLYTVLWPALAALVRATNLQIEMIFVAGYAASLFATFLVVGVLARELTGTTSAGLLAMFLAIFAKSTLAGSVTIDNLFLTRSVALPLALLAFVEIVRDRFVRAGALLGLAFVFHPLTGVYAAGIAAIGATLAAMRGRAREVAIAAAIFVPIVSPIFLWKAFDPVSLPLVADPEWLALLRLRAPQHIAAFTWSSLHYLAMAALVAVTVASATSFEQRPARFLLVLTFGAVVMCGLAVPFAELLPLSPVVQLQLFRASVFIAFFAIVAYAGALVAAARLELGAPALATLWTMGFAVLYEAEGWPFALIALALVIAAMAAYRRVVGQAIAPETLALLLVALVSGLALAASRANPPMRIRNGQPAAWIDVQRWARARTAKDAVFIVPPGHDGFRIESERAIYGDWKDGTQAFFNATFGREWLTRMHRLGYRPELQVRGLTGMELLDDAYRELERSELLAIARELEPSSVYAVDFAGSKRWSAAEEPAYRNDEYVVYELAPATRAE